MNRINFDCQCGKDCGYALKNGVIWVLESLERFIRNELNNSKYELIITSGARCPEYNALIGGSKNSAHILGLAADISYESNRIKYYILKHLYFCHIKRIGLNEEKSFIHFDIATGLVPNPTAEVQEYPQDVFFDY